MGRLSVETEYDKAVEAVATSLADCLMRKKYGTCTDADCKTCETVKQQQNCLANMPDIDKIRVQNVLSRQMLDRDPPEQIPLTGKEYFIVSVKYWIKSVFEIISGPIIVLLIMAVVLFGLYQCVQGSKLFGQSINDYDYYKYTLPGEPYAAGKYRKHILDILDKTQQYVSDINYDGEVNCIDYACTFKLLWDKQYDPKHCEIVRNKSGTMNHLFIRVRQYAGTPWECIEPQAALKDINRYFMEDFWPSDVYNPVYNDYEEAEYWYNYARRYSR